jgi:hypothetical protein
VEILSLKEGYRGTFHILGKEGASAQAGTRDERCAAFNPRMAQQTIEAKNAENREDFLKARKCEQTSCSYKRALLVNFSKSS